MAKKVGQSQRVEVSLLPEDKGRSGEGGHRSISGVLWITFILVVVGFGVVTAYFRLRASALNNRIAVRVKQLETLKGELAAIEAQVRPVQDLGRRIGLARSALAQHKNGFPLMEILEKTAIPEVVVKQINADVKGTVVLAGSGKTIDTVIRQIISWDNHPEIKEVKISGISNTLSKVGEVEGVEFTATLILDPSLFLSSLQE